MGIKCKTSGIGTWQKQLFVDISTNIDTLVVSLYQRIETRRIEIFMTIVLATSAPPFLLFISEIFVTFLYLVVNRFTRQTLSFVNRGHLFVNTFAHKKRHNKTLLVSSTFLKHARHFDY
jgi:hypothetical protein